jgi:hypothetical protein
MANDFFSGLFSQMRQPSGSLGEARGRSAGNVLSGAVGNVQNIMQGRQQMSQGSDSLAQQLSRNSGGSLPFDSSSGRVPSNLSQQNRYQAPATGTYGQRTAQGQQAFPNLAQAWQNRQPIRDFRLSTLFGGGGEGAAGGSIFGSGGTPSAGVSGGTLLGGGGGIDAGTLYDVFGVSPSTSGYRTMAASLVPALRGDGVVSRVFNDYASGPERTPFGVRFAEYA